MTGQCDVFANPDALEAEARPYLVVLQSDLVSGLSSTVVAPLVQHDQLKGAARLNPVFRVEGRECWLATHELFAVDRRLLDRRVASLADQRDEILVALDFLFVGF